MYERKAAVGTRGWPVVRVMLFIPRLRVMPRRRIIPRLSNCLLLREMSFDIPERVITVPTTARPQDVTRRVWRIRNQAGSILWYTGKACRTVKVMGSRMTPQGEGSWMIQALAAV